MNKKHTQKTMTGYIPRRKAEPGREAIPLINDVRGEYPDRFDLVLPGYGKVRTSVITFSLICGGDWYAVVVDKVQGSMVLRAINAAKSAGSLITTMQGKGYEIPFADATENNPIDIQPSSKPFGIPMGRLEGIQKEKVKTNEAD